MTASRRVMALGMALSMASFSVAETAVSGGTALLVAPARPSAIQVLQDVAAHDERVLLVSYQAGSEPGESVLYLWAAGEWVYVSMADFERGRLFERPPPRIMFFGPPEVLPERLVESAAWAARSFVVPDLDHASILNAVGRLLDFSASEWRAFARRYGLTLRDTHDPLRAERWHEQPHEPVPFEPPRLPAPPRRRRRAEPARPAPPPAEVEADPLPPPVRIPDPPARDPAPSLPDPTPAEPEPDTPVPGIK